MSGQVLGSICKLINWPMGQMWVHSPDQDVLKLMPNRPGEARLSTAMYDFWQQCLPLALKVDDSTLPCQVWNKGKPHLVQDIGATPEDSPLHELAKTAGFTSILGIPVLYHKRLCSVMVMFGTSPELSADIFPQLAKVIKSFVAEVAQVIADMSAASDPEWLAHFLPQLLLRASRVAPDVDPDDSVSADTVSVMPEMANEDQTKSEDRNFA